MGVEFTRTSNLKNFKKALLFKAVLGAFAFSSGAWAQSPSAPAATNASQMVSAEKPFSAGARLSTLGVGFEASYRISKMLAARSFVQGGGFASSFQVNGNTYDGDVTSFSGGIAADFFPIHNSGVKLSAGALVHNTSIDLSMMPKGPLTLGHVTLHPSEYGPIKGKAEFGGFAPMVSMGYEGSLWEASSWTFGAELGMAYLGDAEINNIRSEGTWSKMLNADQNFRKKLNNEKKLVEDEINSYQAYPIISLTAKYRF
jgi:hypothetical protein